MSAIRSFAAVAMGGLALLACDGGRPRVPPEQPIAVVLPADTLIAPVNALASGVWLGDDRWAVLSVETGTVWLADFTARTLKPLGAGPAPEIGTASAIFRQADTLFVTDWARGRVTAWHPDGTLLRVAVTRETAGAALPVARDAAGQFFAERAPDPRRDGSGNRDSAAVTRLRGSAIDTVGRLAPLDVTAFSSNTGERFERRLLSGQDRWGVLPDGSLWIARVSHNRVDWTDAKGQRREGELLPDKVLEVTQVDRELYLRQFPAELRPQAEALPFAAIKPPFDAAFAGSDGTVWLQKSRFALDTVGAYHVVDRSGRFARNLLLLSRGRILAEGDGRLLVAERTATGVRLARVPLPPPPAAPATP